MLFEHSETCRVSLQAHVNFDFTFTMYVLLMYETVINCEDEIQIRACEMHMRAILKKYQRNMTTAENRYKYTDGFKINVMSLCFLHQGKRGKQVTKP